MPTRRYVSDGVSLPGSSAPISQAVVVNGQCYVSGQLSVSASGAYLPGTAREEAERAFANLIACLRLAEFTAADVVFAEVAFADLPDLPAVNAVWEAVFAGDARPARTIFQAAALPFGAKVKVVAVAIRSDSIPHTLPTR